ncbi:YadA-like family protein [Bartonella bacilliformis]|uniref:YadA-like family protein n=1 Tax=Bartonella bacilliformis TaxID=774 RepID=UPI0039E59258
MKEIQPQRGASGCVFLRNYFWFKWFVGSAMVVLLSSGVSAKERVTISVSTVSPGGKSVTILSPEGEGGDSSPLPMAIHGGFLGGDGEEYTVGVLSMNTRCGDMYEEGVKLKLMFDDRKHEEMVNISSLSGLSEQYCESLAEKFRELSENDRNSHNNEALGAKREANAYAAKGVRSRAVGTGAFTTEDAWGAQAYGVGSSARAPATIAVGIAADAVGGGAVAVGGISRANGKNSLALGPQTLAYNDGSVAIGGDPDPDSKFGARALAKNSLSMIAKSYVGQTSDAAIAVGLGAQVRDGSSGGVALGWGAFVDEGVEGGLALGRNAVVSVKYGVALGAGSRVNTPAGVAGYDPGSNDETKNTDPAWKSVYSAVSVGDTDSSITRQITGVAAGTQNTDAVNVAQLQALRDATVLYNRDEDGNKTNKITLQGGDPSQPVALDNLADGNVTEGSKQAVNGGQLYDFMQVQTDYTKEQTRRVLKDAKGYTDKKFNALSYEIDGARKEARQGAAIGLAVSNLRYDDTPGKFSLAFGAGMWRGESAVALGSAYTSENGRVRSNLSATSGGGHWGVGAGLSLTLN